MGRNFGWLAKEKSMKGEEINFANAKASSSKVPAFELIPYNSLVRLATRFEVGIERKKEKAWNALSDNQEVLRDLPFVLNRAGHASHHAQRLIAILKGQIPDDGDDHAAAIAWSGHFLCEATDALKKPYGETVFPNQHVTAASSCKVCAILAAEPPVNQSMYRTCPLCGNRWILTVSGNWALLIVGREGASQ